MTNTGSVDSNWVNNKSPESDTGINAGRSERQSSQPLEMSPL